MPCDIWQYSLYSFSSHFNSREITNSSLNNKFIIKIIISNIKTKNSSNKLNLKASFFFTETWFYFWNKLWLSIILNVNHSFSTLSEVMIFVCSFHFFVTFVSYFDGLQMWSQNIFNHVRRRWRMIFLKKIIFCISNNFPLFYS